MDSVKAGCGCIFKPCDEKEEVVFNYRDRTFQTVWERETSTGPQVTFGGRFNDDGRIHEEGLGGPVYHDRSSSSSGDEDVYINGTADHDEDDSERSTEAPRGRRRTSVPRGETRRAQRYQVPPIDRYPQLPRDRNLRGRHATGFGRRNPVNCPARERSRRRGGRRGHHEGHFTQNVSHPRDVPPRAPPRAPAAAPEAHRGSRRGHLSLARWLTQCYENLRLLDLRNVHIGDVILLMVLLATLCRSLLTETVLCIGLVGLAFLVVAPCRRVKVRCPWWS